MKKFACLVCGYSYSPEMGDPEQSIPKKTDFEDLPEDWACPDCGADKNQFEPL
ncbi:MAG: rubredoxin [Clostridiales bacterium]|nr:rubredoxin [Clostridiales bacterium]